MSQASRTEAEPAGLLRRLGVLLYDGMLVFAVGATVVVAWVMVTDTPLPPWAVQLAMLAALFGFKAYFWMYRGQTLGMRAWQLQLVDSDGRNVGAKAVMIRLLVAPFSILLGGLGYWWLLFSSQTWHDKASDTFVVYVPKAKP